MTEEEAIAEAKKRFEARKDEIKGFDRKKNLRRVVYDLYKIDLDVLFPSGEYDFSTIKSEEEVKKELNARATKIVNQTYPPDMRGQLEKDAQEKFPFYKLGDQVEVKYGHPNGEVLTHTGELQECEPAADWIIVGDKKILLADLKSPTRVCFDEKRTTLRRKNYVLNRYDKPRMDEKMKIKDKLEPDVYKEFGWVKEKGEWVSLETMYPTKIEPEFERRESAHYQNQAAKIKKDILRQMREERLIVE